LCLAILIKQKRAYREQIIAIIFLKLCCSIENELANTIYKIPILNMSSLENLSLVAIELPKKNLIYIGYANTRIEENPLGA
jgi:hypothetical protein